MAISTYKTFLMLGTETGSGISYSKLLDVKTTPDLGGIPEMLDATTMSDGARVFVLGIQETEAMTFDANYTLADYSRVKALEGTVQHFAVWLGGTVANEIATPTGSDGKFEFDGYITATKTGGGVNEIQNMTVTIAPTTVISETQGNSTVPSVMLNTHVVHVAKDATVRLHVTTVPDGETVTWASSATTYATVDAGVVTGEAVGSSIVSASITVDGVTYNDTCTVIVDSAS